MEPFFSFEEMFNPINQPILGSDGSQIVFANTAAKSVFGSGICQQPLFKLFPPEVLDTSSENFAVSAKLCEKSARIYVQKKGGFSLYFITPEETSGESLILTRRMLSYLRNCATGIKLSADRYFSRIEENKTPDERLVSILYHYYYRLARTIIQLDSADKLERREMVFSPVTTDMVSLCSELTKTLSNMNGYGSVITKFYSEEERLLAE